MDNSHYSVRYNYEYEGWEVVLVIYNDKKTTEKHVHIFEQKNNALEHADRLNESKNKGLI